MPLRPTASDFAIEGKWVAVIGGVPQSGAEVQRRRFEKISGRDLPKKRKVCTWGAEFWL